MTVHPKNHAQKTPQKLAYVIPEDDVAVSYGELDGQSNQFAQVFRKLGLEVGDGVAFLLENRQGFFELCWAAQRAGLYYTPVSTHLTASEIIYIITNSQARMFVLSASYPELAQEIAAELPPQILLVSLGGDIDGYEAIEAELECVTHDPLADETAGSSMLYSSGTTGYPKGIRHPLSGAAPDVYPPRFETFCQRYQFDHKTVYLSPAPLYHAAPLTFTMAVMATGGTCVVMKRFDAEAALALIEQLQVTHSQWVPTMFVRLLRLDEKVRKQYQLDSHRVAIHAAAPCPVDVKTAMINWWGPIIYEFYAGSEGVGTTFITAEEWLQRPGSVGRSVDGQLHIVDDAGNELPPGEIGGVYFADAPTFEYHNAPEKTAAARTAAGWGTLGDVGYVDEAGYLYLTDRKANMIISGGVNIYPQEAENALLGHPAVLDAAVFGIPDEDFGEAVKAAVELAPGFSASAELAQTLMAYCRQKIAAIKCPRSIDFETQLPRLPNGKLYKRKLKQRYWPQS